MTEDTLYKSLYIRNFHLPTLKKLKHIAVDSNKTLSYIIDAACKEFILNHNSKQNLK